MLRSFIHPDPRILLRHAILASLAILAMPQADASPTADFAKLADAIPPDCRQAVVVISKDWSASVGRCALYTRGDGRQPWSAVGSSFSVLLGRRGMAWAEGLFNPPAPGAPHKSEGDGCAPAGLFTLGPVFGRIQRQRLPWLRMPLIELQPDSEAVDDPASKHYNQIVRRGDVTSVDWKSAERMFTIPDYELGLVVGANPRRTAGSGSCLFVHLWSGNRQGTSGCTALRREDLLALLRWLDPSAHPVLIQLPEDRARALEQFK